MRTFGECLRQLRKENKLTQKDLAEKLGLAQTTIANYEKDIRFPDQNILNKIADIFKVSIDYLLGRTEMPYTIGQNIVRKENNKIDYEKFLKDLNKKYIDSLLKAQKDVAMNLILDALKKNIDIKDIYIEVFQKSLIEIGELWEKNQIDVADEHYFSLSTQLIMAQIYPYISNSSKKDCKVISVSAGGEMHNLGLRIVTDFLKMDGWDNYFLGSYTPTKSIIKTIKKYDIDLLAISVTMPHNIDSAKNIIETIRLTSDCKNIKILVGGNAINQDIDIWKKIGADGYSKDAIEAIRVANDLVKNQ